MFVFHVTGSEKDGIYTPEGMRERFPDIYTAMENVDATFMQYGNDAEKSVIVKKEPASKFDPTVIEGPTRPLDQVSKVSN